MAGAKRPDSTAATTQRIPKFDSTPRMSYGYRGAVLPVGPLGSVVGVPDLDPVVDARDRRAPAAKACEAIIVAWKRRMTGRGLGVGVRPAGVGAGTAAAGAARGASRTGPRPVTMEVGWALRAILHRWGRVW